jgi:hypothetical protein
MMTNVYRFETKKKPIRYTKTALNWDVFVGNTLVLRFLGYLLQMYKNDLQINAGPASKPLHRWK